MANQFYFGTAERMMWLPTPNFNMPANNVSWRTSGTLLNGGGYARSSTSSHMEYSMAWPLMSRGDSYSLIDYFNGIYGDGPFYFIDPVAAAYNILPNWMATPRIQAADGPSMVAGQVPTLSAAIATNNNYPTRTATYTLGANQVGKSFSFPVPPGYTMRFGWHGTATSTARVRVVGATTVDTSPISSTGSTIRFNATVLPDATGFVTVSLIGGASGGTLALRGMTAIVTPTTGLSVRTNLMLNPRLGTNASGWTQQLGTGEAATLVRVTGAADGPLSYVSTYYRKAVTTVRTGGTSGIFERDAANLSGSSGDVITASIYVRPSVTTDVRCAATPRLAGAGSGAATNGATVTCPAGVWTRLTATHTTTAAYDSVQIWAVEVTTLPVGATIDVTCAMLNSGPTSGGYFDGSTPSAGATVYAWTGTPDASTSTETTLANPITGDFVSGRGHSGVALKDDPSVTEYSAVLTNTAIGVSANFIETGAWV